MKKQSKVLLTMLCAVLLVVGSVLGTLAYFTDQDTVTNTFTVGEVSITLDEADVKPDGTIDTNDRVKENEYHLLPGHTYTKDPTVTVVKGSEDVYVRMIVTVNMSSEWDAICAKYKVPTNELFLGLGDQWELQGHPAEDVVNNTRTYEFWYKTVVAKNADKNTVLQPLFTAIKMPDQMTNDDLASLGEDFKIEVVAHAIQADGFDSAADAWAKW